MPTTNNINPNKEYTGTETGSGGLEPTPRLRLSRVFSRNVSRISSAQAAQQAIP